MTKIFDYKGLDSINRGMLYISNVVSVETELRKIYIDRLERFNKENLEKNPEPFRFFRKENCSILFFLLPFEFDGMRASQIFILSTPNQRKVQFFILSEKELSDIDSYEFWMDFFYNKILPSHGYDRSQIIFDITDYYESLQLKSGYTLFEENFNTEQFIKNHALISKCINLIKTESSQFRKVNQTPLSYFAKDAYKFPFSLFDLKPLIELVNDDDFSYQLDQAMAAYHENLFLPCAATLGVVLETLCIKILEENKVKKVKSGDTQLGVLKARLREEGITSRRDNTRLDVAYQMRNMASHSSPGVALKEDCHFMLNVINTIAFEYLSKEQD